MEDSIIKIKLVLEDKSEKQTDISVHSSCLNINDDFVEQLFGMKFTDNKIINCNIVLAANNLAVNIENYSLTEVINISGFFNSPSKVSTFKSRGTNVHIVNQEINILQLDCQKILLAESCVKQFDIGLFEHNMALRKVSEGKKDISTTYKMKEVDIRDCTITKLRTFIECNYINIQESILETISFYTGFGSSLLATIKKMKIWNNVDIKTCEVSCKIEEVTIEDSIVTTMIAKERSIFGKIETNNTQVMNAHGFNKSKFSEFNMEMWQLISKSAESSNNSSLRAEANYQITKNMYKEEKGINKIIGVLFDFCTGYGYKPLRIIKTFIVLTISTGAISVARLLVMGKSINYLKILQLSVAAIAGQQGLELKDGFQFWIYNIEYCIGVILFAMFVNALYVRYNG